MIEMVTIHIKTDKIDLEMSYKEGKELYNQLKEVYKTIDYETIPMYTPPGVRRNIQTNEINDIPHTTYCDRTGTEYYNPDFNLVKTGAKSIPSKEIKETQMDPVNKLFPSQAGIGRSVKNGL